MYQVPALAAVGGLILTAGVASAQVIDLPDMKFSEHDAGSPANETFDLDFDLSGEKVLGFRVSFDYLDQVGDSSWSSDLELQVTAPNGSTWVIGQFSFNAGDPFGEQDDIWDFDGPDDDNPKSFRTSEHLPWESDPIQQDGTWNFMFTETWDGQVLYTNVMVEIIKIPGPGALALLGVAGLVGSTRRRRACRI